MIRILALVLVVFLASCIEPVPVDDPVAFCGDGVVDAGEECDAGSLNGVACTPPAGGTCTYCSNDCKIITLTGPPLEEPPIVDDFTLFVDKDSVNGPCSDEYSRGQNSLSKPWCTIQRAADLVEPGDTVRVERGVYDEYVSITRSGTSDDPIVFSGVRDADGGWLTGIRGGVLASNWVLAPEIDPDGYGVYKTELGFRPYAMMADGRRIMHLYPSNNDWLAFAPDQMGRDPALYWDGIDGTFGYNTATGETYVRFRDGDDPNGMTIYAAPGGWASSSGMLVRDASDVVLRDFEIMNTQYGVTIAGSGSRDVVVEHNRIVNSQSMIEIRDSARDARVRHNLLVNHWLSDEYSQGQWGGNLVRQGHDETTSYQLAVQAHLYATPKDDMFRGFAIEARSGSGHELYNNTILDSYFGISIGNSQDVRAHGNRIVNASSVGFVVQPGAMNTSIHHNEIRNVNIPLRLQTIHGTSPRSVYFYNNKMISRPRAGSGTYFHAGHCTTPINTDNEIWIYHNSYSGYGVGIWAGCTSLANDSGLPNLYVLNNVVSSMQLGVRFSGDWFGADRIGWVDHNWLLSDAPQTAPWWGSNNVVAGSRNDWMWAEEDDSFILPADSPARSAGLDLSRSFVLNGKTYQPLPGMEPGYYSGSAPHMGAVQD